MKLVTRKAWGARAPKTTPLKLKRVTAGVFHYSAFNGDEQAAHANCPGRVRAIQNFHMDSRGWNDIAYNFLACRHGYLFEGRGWDNMSAATFGANDHTQACCFLGDDTAGMSDLGILGRRALADYAHAYTKRYGNANYKGHRDFTPTTCPGDEIYSFINSKVFNDLVNVDNTKRLAALRKWILARRAEGWTWNQIKATPNWREFVRRGGK